jgi:hypothetical protein
VHLIKNLKLGLRLALGFGLVLVLLLGVSLLGISRMGEVQDRLEDIARVNNQEARFAVAMRIAVNQIAIATRDVILQTEEPQMRAAASQVAKSRANYDAAEEELGKMFTTLSGTTQAEKDVFAKIKDLKSGTRPLIDKVIELGLANKNDEATKVMST